VIGRNTSLVAQPSLTILDVGHGNCTVLQSGRRARLVDAGPGAAVLEHLRERDIHILDAVLISRADADHSKGLVNILSSQKFEVRLVKANGDAEKRSKTWAAIAYELDQLDRDKKVVFEESLHEGEVFWLPDSDVSLSVLAPRKRLTTLGAGSSDREGRAIGTNTISAVIRVDKACVPVALLAGDIDAVGLDHLRDSRVRLDAPVLVFPHHGGHCADGTNPPNIEFAREICRLVKPQTVLFSIGRGKHGTPRPEIISTIKTELPKARIVCTQLSERCAAILQSAADSHLLATYARGRVSGGCCAGTLTIRMDSAEVEPLGADHRAFIDVAAPTALCLYSTVP
jgi:beta-lactamase superfamily II metal-dependent hydrolase